MAPATQRAREVRQAGIDAPIMALVNSYKSASPSAHAALREVMLDLMRDDEAAKANETAHAKIKDD